MPQLQEAAQREKKARDLEKEDITLAKEYAKLVAEYNIKLSKIISSVVPCIVASAMYAQVVTKLQALVQTAPQM